MQHAAKTKEKLNISNKRGKNDKYVSGAFFFLLIFFSLRISIVFSLVNESSFHLIFPNIDIIWQTVRVYEKLNIKMFLYNSFSPTHVQFFTQQIS